MGSGPDAKRRPSWWWLPTVLWMAAIFAMSSVPGSKVPGRWGYLPHFVEYAFLAVLAVLAVRHTTRLGRSLAVAVLIASLYGATDEFHQAFVPGRTPDVVDWAVDTLGAAVGAGLGLLAYERRAARSGPSRQGSSEPDD